ncbi:MAG: hypothetical protein GF317_18640 [Candidatus Lokiarchaeota archaeon]|nr:hypothetical protein [Candidatus Lokiarchaeota archaeon]MBD3201535.1 hypothetical protein [Candidatus Lokiarchaeota archaeon]
MTDQNDNSTGKDKLLLELVPCEKCGNPFMKKPDDNDLICDNCIELEKRKRKLQIGVFEKVIEVENQMEASINEMKSQLTLAKGKFNKQFFLDKIKKRSDTLKKSIELVEKIEETDDEKYIEEYKKLYEKLKKESS